MATLILSKCTLTSLQSVSGDNISPNSSGYWSDLAAEWLSGVPANPATWSNKATGSSVFHEIELQNPQAFTESGERAQDGKAYYAMLSVGACPVPVLFCFHNIIQAPGMSWQIGISPDVNEQFASMAKLTNQAIDNTGSYSQSVQPLCTIL